MLVHQRVFPIIGQFPYCRKTPWNSIEPWIQHSMLRLRDLVAWSLSSQGKQLWSPGRDEYWHIPHYFPINIPLISHYFPINIPLISHSSQCEVRGWPVGPLPIRVATDPKRSRPRRFPPGQCFGQTCNCRCTAARQNLIIKSCGCDWKWYPPDNNSRGRMMIHQQNFGNPIFRQTHIKTYQDHIK